jgi:uncharacterized membrane protein YphA (DoxX/SURF4 family)
MNIALWVIQGLLALVFLMAGFMKASQPIEKLKKRMNYVNYTSAGIVRLIGILEFLGAVGLILPAATGILPWLTPVAAIGLVLAMIGAIIVHFRLNEAKAIGTPLILLLLALIIVIGRFAIAPLA